MFIFCVTSVLFDFCEVVTLIIPQEVIICGLIHAVDPCDQIQSSQSKEIWL